MAGRRDRYWCHGMMLIDPCLQVVVDLEVEDCEVITLLNEIVGVKYRLPGVYMGPSSGSLTEGHVTIYCTGKKYNCLLLPIIFKHKLTFSFNIV